MPVYLEYNTDEVKYDSYNDMIDFYDADATYLNKVQPLLIFDKNNERESKPKHLSVRTLKPVFFLEFKDGNLTNTKRFNLRFPGRDTLTIDPETNVLRTFDTREIGSAFLNELGGPCKNDEDFVWNKSECKKQ